MTMSSLIGRLREPVAILGEKMGFINKEWITEKGNNGKEWEIQVAAYLFLLGYILQGVRVNMYGTEMDIFATTRDHESVIVECHDSRHRMGHNRIRRLMGVYGINNASNLPDGIPILATTGELTHKAEATVYYSDILWLKPRHVWRASVPQGMKVHENRANWHITEKDLPVDWDPSEISWLERNGVNGFGHQAYKHKNMKLPQKYQIS